MRRNVYLSEYEDMTFRERFYIYRKNRMGISIKKLTPPNPLDWSVRVLLRGVRNVVGLPVYFILYLPFAINGAVGLKTRYANDKDKLSTHHANLKVIK
ncbi:TMhelix containing protein [Vibrio phage 1.284.A._10N.286.55.A5]|nr:TMhelix containing protein [Vibrio phage 1.284.A._10N.286.55.A5]AUS01615.1 TMhelix containing protein [Vibrio phage 1.287.O._10N.286.55.C7]AUS01685.1 TMhelix containing protein [Vibrio phage 1.289.A._10N.286.55.E8]